MRVYAFFVSCVLSKAAQSAAKLDTESFGCNVSAAKINNKEAVVTDTIELRGFMQLDTLFRSRHWETPHFFKLDREVTGPELIALLDVRPEDVEVIFVNFTAFPVDRVVIHPGDRVALAPPGIPGPYRVLLGFKELEPGSRNDQAAS